MMVTFISQCQKNSLKITRQILDAYANRIGERTWQTMITQEGLKAVKSRLAKTARKTTAVACHRIHGTKRTELVWVVGNKGEFDAQGNVPVNRTQRDIMREDWENDWQYLQLIKVLVALAALFHDFGKSWDHFQTMLTDAKKKDPIRHEWISLLLFKALVQGKTDEQWLDELENLKEASPKEREKFSKQLIAKAKPCKQSEDYPFEVGFSTLASWISWLIVTHHKLPLERGESSLDGVKKPLARQAILTTIHRSQGYIKEQRELTKPKDWTFSEGLPLLSGDWCNEVARWVKKAKLLLENMAEAKKAERLILTLARLSLMVGDHHYSSQPADAQWQTSLSLIANTKADGTGKQKLDEHLVGVNAAALKAVHLLPKFEKDLPTIEQLKALRKPAKGKFAWQNKAVETLSDWRQKHKSEAQGFFAINMASTGYGKTFANAKVMGALTAKQHLRYNLALGLRTLTLQTGDEYRAKLNLDNTQMAVLVGSSAVRFLHEQNNQNKTLTQELDHILGADLEESNGSASAQELDDSFDIDITLADTVEEHFSTLFQGSKAKKAKQLLYAPVVVCTIDHLMPATESLAGGKHILPTLRLMSADLVIDEVDDFNQEDLPALVRLVHLVGMLGRKVMISSATIPPAMAEGLFQAYQAGWQIFAFSRKRNASVTSFWLDEFSTQIDLFDNTADFNAAHQTFISKRLISLAREKPQRKALIHDVARPTSLAKADIEQYWFAQIRQSALQLHQAHQLHDEKSDKDYSVGVIRVAHIDPCIRLAEYLFGCELPDDCDVRVMSYHSRQVLLLRSELEKHLDQVLNRKDAKQPAHHPLIQRHLQASTKKQVIFIVVASPVAEVGRDHDYDWAVIEPSSMRSIIQMAGRVRRHRPVLDELAPNLVLLEYNLTSLLAKSDQDPAFFHPGYESRDKSKGYCLNTHSLKPLVASEVLTNKVDASLRIQAENALRPRERLADLEHQVLNDSLLKADYRPQAAQAWLKSSFYLLGLAQYLTPFRESQPDTVYKLHITEEGELKLRFPAKDLEHSGQVPHHLKVVELEPHLKTRLWLSLDYENLIEQYRAVLGYSIAGACEYLGEVRLEDRQGETKFSFVPELGFLKIK